MKATLRLRDRINGAPVHKRMLDLRTYPADDDHIIVEGYLKDDRVKGTYDINGEIEEPGVIHDMVIRILVGGAPLSIIDAEAEMINVPYELCPSTLDSIKEIIGLKIKGGFGENVHRRIGGVKGCIHLTHLLVTMAQEAVHGYWINKSTKRPPDQESFNSAETRALLLNSCKLWRKDGPLVKAFQESFKKKNRS